MEIKAELNFLRMSPRKARLTIDMIRGKKIADALNIVKFSSRWAAKPVLKLLQSAIANATHNFNLQKENLYIKTIRVDNGPMLKRWSARAFGRASEIQKKTSHIEIILGEIKQEEKPEAKTAEVKDKKVETEKKAKTPKLKVQNKRAVAKEKKK